MTLELSLDLLVVERNSYTLLDLLSDVGGIASILTSAITLFLSITNYRYFDSYMVSHLYQPTDPASSQFEPKQLSNVKLFCMDQLPAAIRCCRRSPKQAAIEEAMRVLESETDIIQMIRMRRLFKQALKQLMGEEAIAEIERTVDYLPITTPLEPPKETNLFVKLRPLNAMESSTSPSVANGIQHSVNGLDSNKVRPCESPAAE